MHGLIVWCYSALQETRAISRLSHDHVCRRSAEGPEAFLGHQSESSGAINPIHVHTKILEM